MCHVVCSRSYLWKGDVGQPIGNTFRIVTLMGISLFERHITSRTSSLHARVAPSLSRACPILPRTDCFTIYSPPTPSHFDCSALHPCRIASSPPSTVAAWEPWVAAHIIGGHRLQHRRLLVAALVATVASTCECQLQHDAFGGVSSPAPAGAVVAHMPIVSAATRKAGGIKGRRCFVAPWSWASGDRR